MIEVETMVLSDLVACQDMVARSAFFQSYGIAAEKMVSWLEAALQRPEAELHVARLGEAIAGFSWVIVDGGFDRTPYLRLLAVDDRYHRKGVGRALMDAMEERHAVHRDLLLLVTQTNRKARRFYESLGYQKVGLLEDYVKEGVHECIYRKSIAVKNL